MTLFKLYHILRVVSWYNFDSKISLDEAVELIKSRSRKYAKRQYTWFNNQMNINWFNLDFDNFDNTICDVINYIEGGYLWH